MCRTIPTRCADAVRYTARGGPRSLNGRLFINEGEVHEDSCLCRHRRVGRDPCSRAACGRPRYVVARRCGSRPVVRPDASRFERSARVPLRRRQHLRLVARSPNVDARRHGVATDFAEPVRTAKHERVGAATGPDAVSQFGGSTRRRSGRPRSIRIGASEPTGVGHRPLRRAGEVVSRQSRFLKGAPGHRRRSARRRSMALRISWRPASSSTPQRAISSRLRRQPTQRALAGSMRQTPMHGDGTGDCRTSGLDPDRSSRIEKLWQWRPGRHAFASSARATREFVGRCRKSEM